MKIELSERDIADLKKIRNYFGINDKTSFQHFSFKVLDDIIKKAKQTNSPAK